MYHLQNTNNHMTDLETSHTLLDHASTSIVIIMYIAWRHLAI